MHPGLSHQRQRQGAVLADSHEPFLAVAQKADHGGGHAVHRAEATSHRRQVVHPDFIADGDGVLSVDGGQRGDRFHVQRSLWAAEWGLPLRFQLYTIRYGISDQTWVSSSTVTSAGSELGDPEPVPFAACITCQPALATQWGVLAIRQPTAAANRCSLASFAPVAVPLLPLGVGGVRHLQDAMERCRD
jgi:hypothetical protein